MARSFLGSEFAGGESAWWRGNWIPKKSLSGKDIGVATLQYVYSLFMQSKQKAFGKQ